MTEAIITFAPVVTLLCVGVPAASLAYVLTAYAVRCYRARRARRVFEASYRATREELHNAQRLKALHLAHLRDELSN